ncbi:ankyrin repeat domain-containing protein 45 isoform X2 [Amia ocellicauda]|uniref:ankyrin repeat domain-containing protein 45 isoform X2 n=1 Tax=Amia ocellicauda TaxID=2972642 RepID=UPI00346403BC
MRSGEENPILHCSLSGDIEGLRKLFENIENDTVDHKEKHTMFLQEKDDVGRNILFAACMLGRSEVARELVKRGSDVNESTARGYTPLHCSALWGQLETVKMLVELGADMQAVNFRGERAREVACRYSKMDCAKYLSWAEAKQDLLLYISRIRETIADPEKVHGRLNKEDKNTCLNSCTSKYDWIQNTKNPTAQDFVDQKKHLEDVLKSILAKLMAPTSEPSKTHKR